MTVHEFQTLMKQITSLSKQEKIRLIDELYIQVQKENHPKDKRRSVLELRGLGKEIWKKIDVQEYIDEERSSWDG